MNQPKQYVFLLLFLLCQVVMTGCTETVHALIRIERLSPSTDSGLLRDTLRGLGWTEDKISSSGEVVFRNPSLPNCYLRQGSTQALPIEITFVRVGANHFGPTEVAAYRRLANALASALGESSVTVENIDAKV